MVVTIDEIPEGGLEVDEPIEPAFVQETLTADRDTGFRANGGATLKATLHKVGGGVLLSGRFEAAVKSPCKRCLADVSRVLPVDFTLNFVRRDPVETEPGVDAAEDDERAEKGGSFALDAADAEPFDGKTIDLDPVVREQLLLALPMHVVCREDCQGLCGMCGQNLNEATCQCRTERIDPRWAALKDIKLS